MLNYETFAGSEIESGHTEKERGIPSHKPTILLLTTENRP
jgi:hypothetical protein